MGEFNWEIFVGDVIYFGLYWYFEFVNFCYIDFVNFDVFNVSLDVLLGDVGCCDLLNLDFEFLDVDGINIMLYEICLFSLVFDDWL